MAGAHDIKLVPPADAPPPQVFTPRGVDTEGMIEALVVARESDHERSIGAQVVMFGGWGLSLVFALLFAFALKILSDVPKHHDDMYVSYIRPNGQPLPPIAVDDMTPSQKKDAGIEFIANYIQWRNAYRWEDIQHYFDLTKALTHGAARDDYIAWMTQGPQRPTLMYEKNGTATLDPAPNSMFITITGPNSYEIVFKLLSSNKDAVKLPPRCYRARIATMVMMTMPPAFARLYDPLRLVVVGYDQQPAAYNFSVAGGC